MNIDLSSRLKVKLFILVAMVLLTVASYVVYSTMGDGATYPLAILLSIMCSTVFYSGEKVTFYNPITLLSISYFLFFALGGYYLTLDIGTDYAYAQIFSEQINDALMFSILTFYFIHLGYYSFGIVKEMKGGLATISGFLPDINSYELDSKKIGYNIILIMLIGWGSRIVIIATGAYKHLDVGGSYLTNELSFIAQFIMIFSTLPILGVAVLYAWKIRNNVTTYNRAIVLFTIMEFAYALPSAGKERILYPFFILLVVRSIYKSFPVRPLAIVTIITIVFVFPLSTIYRDNNDTVDFVGALSLYFSYISDFSFLRVEEMFALVFGQRLNYCGILAVLIDNTPAIWDFKMGATYIEFFIAIIPRFLWPGKPLIAAWGDEFAREYGLVDVNNTLTSVGSTSVGEMFLNFGWYGCIIGLMYGLLYRLVMVYFFKKELPSVFASVIAAFVIYNMIRFDTFTGEMTGIIQRTFIFVLFLYPSIKKIKKPGKELGQLNSS